jgi:octaprenyl-diphosphate synthase
MKSLREIKEIIKSDLSNFEALLKKELNSDDELLQEKTLYLFESKGKRVRPILVYLFSRLFGKPYNLTHNSALIIEILHTATLIHDDVVDNADLRRGKETFNRKWDNKNAVLLGDYLFAKCMQLISENNLYKVFEIVSPVLVELSYGELQQLKYNQKDVCSIDEYFEIINKKTASLISASCVLGAISGGANDDSLEDVNRFGRIIGEMFQIGDDILDYNGSSEIGKDSGNDIEERKMTLPLIYALNNAPENEKVEIMSVWSGKTTDSDEKSLIRNFTRKNNGIKDAEKLLEELALDANRLLDKFDNNTYRKALEVLISIIVKRKK